MPNKYVSPNVPTCLQGNPHSSSPPAAMTLVILALPKAGPSTCGPAPPPQVLHAALSSLSCLTRVPSAHPSVSLAWEPANMASSLKKPHPSLLPFPEKLLEGVIHTCSSTSSPPFPMEPTPFGLLPHHSSKTALKVTATSVVNLAVS